MALTCKAWLDVGLDALWEEITDLSNLLILIPEWQEYRRAQDRLLHAFYADQDDRYELYSKLQLRLQQQASYSSLAQDGSIDRCAL
ncbi:hypothetical protein PUNSTDRAFT_128811 [Punctularia strigosozonata HHB-11173 SS5]|uniref:uncharacterized protein n=1 Tax=Punctularia strigosozonata (strain HHB-11173) TaxID=741275 RepID=UPI000441627F|nr:uncharacterized protein PUNSTDRAFT_128811 [Punctularia strigosozonata HHB-11173 SS5]EIN13127.1 hypothetical protein PUNSTDRAFT_128811 [Punctularia strigosozonata HHB-11173 SS5]